MIKNKDIIESFTKYVQINTQSDPNSTTCPSTKIQFDLANILVQDLKNIGFDEVELDDNGYIFAKIKSNIDKKVPTVGFLAHMDTAPDLSGNNVLPKVINNYDGNDIYLNEKYKLSPTDFPEMKNYINKTLITTDGNTLLGGDDKAGITAIIESCKYLIANPSIKHGDIMIGFTPDEEIGRGANLFDVEKFGADFAYTIDGGEIGELQYQNFNAASFSLQILGRNVHPGTAKNKMIDSIKIGREFDHDVPNERPYNTSDYEGFYMLSNFTGTIDETNLHYIIRDHDELKFKQRKQLLINLVEHYQNTYPDSVLNFTIEDSYYNMEKMITPHPHIMNIAKLAFEKANVVAKVTPIRGGTDGSRLSYMGLPTPNIFTGGHNFHGRFEYAVVESIAKASEIIINIANLVSDYED